MSIRTVSAALLLVAMGATTASAQEWTRSGPNGTATRTYTAGEGLAVSRQGVNGGSSEATASCRGNGVCDRSFSATNRYGETVSGDRVTAWGPGRLRSTTTVTGPAGNSGTVFRGRPYYPRPVFGPRVYRVR